MAVLITPVPNGLVRTSRSPGFMPRLVRTFFGWTNPVTDRPYLSSPSSMLCPPTSATPASFILSRPPASIRRRMERSICLSGKPTRFMAVFGSPPHGVDVAQRVGRGDLTEPVRIVYDRREKIDGLDQCEVLGNLIDPGIVRPLQSDNHVGVGRDVKPAKRSGQVPWRQLGRSAGALHGLAQAEFLRFTHYPSPLARLLFPSLRGRN